MSSVVIIRGMRLFLFGRVFFDQVEEYWLFCRFAVLLPGGRSSTRSKNTGNRFSRPANLQHSFETTKEKGEFSDEKSVKSAFLKKNQKKIRKNLAE